MRVEHSDEAGSCLEDWAFGALGSEASEESDDFFCALNIS